MNRYKITLYVEIEDSLFADSKVAQLAAAVEDASLALSSDHDITMQGIKVKRIAEPVVNHRYARSI